MTDPAEKEVTVLVADDDAAALNLIHLGLSELNFTVIEAHDGSAALNMFQQIQPDMVILDLMMPGLSGSEVCQQIKKSERGEHVPVLILTACGRLEDKVGAFDCGADDYLTKPFHFDELRARVRALLRVRELNLKLVEKNKELLTAQEKLIEQERKLLVMQLAGTAAHQLGQPLSAILLNCHLLERVKQEDERFKKALTAIKQDAQRMVGLIEKLRTADPRKKENYFGSTEILDIKE